MSQVDLDFDTAAEEETPSALDEFFSEGAITAVLNIIKSGKEASAYLCRASPSIGAKYAVAKVYHERSRRNFANDAVYASGRSMLQAIPGQVGRALKNKSEFGRTVQGAIWVDREFETMFTLRDGGLDVPDVFAATEQAVLMEYIGDGSGAAPQLQHVDLDEATAREMWARLLWNIEEMLRLDTIHGDLSAYNVLAWKGRAVIIDFPQAVDPRFSEAAKDLLERDLRNLGRYFARYGISIDPPRLANRLWWNWKNNRPVKRFRVPGGRWGLACPGRPSSRSGHGGPRLPGFGYCVREQRRRTRWPGGSNICRACGNER